PPEEVLEGRFGRKRHTVEHLALDRRHWEIEFLPFREADQLVGILGRVSLLPAEAPSTGGPLPERLVDLRRRVGQRYALADSGPASPVQSLLARQVRVASRAPTAPVVLLGEKGVGKQWIARAIHEQ